MMYLCGCRSFQASFPAMIWITISARNFCRFLAPPRILNRICLIFAPVWIELIMSQGWVKSWRKIKNWEWYRTPNMAHLFQHLFREANSEDGRWQGIEVKRGQIVTGIESLSLETGISVRSVRTCLERLKSTRELTIKTTNKYSIITLCNYDSYQENFHKNDHQNDHQNDQQSTSNRPAIDHKQEDQEDQEDKEKRDRKETRPPQTKTLFLEFVYLTPDEHQKLIERLGDNDTRAYIERLNNYIGSKGKKYKSHYHTILNWRQKDAETSKPASKDTIPPVIRDVEGKTPADHARERIEKLRKAHDDDKT